MSRAEQKEERRQLILETALDIFCCSSLGKTDLSLYRVNSKAQE